MFLEPQSSTPIFKLTASNARFNLDGIISLALNPSSTLAVVGGGSGGIRMVNLSKGEVVGSLSGHKDGESVEAIQFVDFGGGYNVVVSGGSEGKACVFDLNTMRLRSTHEHQVCLISLL